jgi:hypothetical protein
MLPRFLSERFQPKGNLEVVVPSTGRAGDSIPVEVHLRLQENVEPRQARIELVGRETYYERRTDTDSRGHSRTRIVKREADFSRLSQTLEREFQLVSGTEYYWSASIAIPPDAPSTCRGKLIDIRWVVKGVLDVPKRRDLVQQVPIQVQGQDTAPAPGNGGGNTSTLAMEGFEECNLILMLEQGALTQGQNLQGRFQMEAMKEFSVRAISVQLVQVENAGARDSKEVAVRECLSEPASFRPHESYSYDFVLTMPLEAPPTASSPHSSLAWWVEAILDRPLRTDFSVGKEVYVYVPS